MLNAEQNQKLLAAINSSITALFKLGFRTDTIWHKIIDDLPIDEKAPNINLAYIKHMDEFRKVILEQIKKKFAVNPTVANTATAINSAAAPAPNTATTPMDYKQSEDKNNLIHKAMTHFIRLRLLFLGMSVANQEEYTCVNPNASLMFGDATVMPLKLDLVRDGMQILISRQLIDWVEKRNVQKFQEVLNQYEASNIDVHMKHEGNVSIFNLVTQPNNKTFLDLLVGKKLISVTKEKITAPSQAPTFSEIRAAVQQGIMSLVGEAPVPYPTSIGELKEPPQRDNLFKLIMVPAAAYIFCNNELYYINKLTAPNTCDNLSKQLGLSPEQCKAVHALITSNGFTRLIEEQLEQINKITKHKQPLQGSSDNALTYLNSQLQDTIKAQVQASVQSATMEYQAQLKEKETTLTGLNTSYRHILKATQVTKAQNIGVLKKVDTVAAQNQALKAQAKPLFTEAYGDMSETLPDEFAHIADLLGVDAALVTSNMSDDGGDKAPIDARVLHPNR